MDIRQFEEPAGDYRPVTLWSWNDYLTEQEVVRQIEEFADKGFGGFFMHPRVGLLTKYNTKEWFDTVRLCVKTARKNGIYAWLYDEDKWPSGYGSGEVPLANEAYRNRALVLLQADEITPDDTVLATYVHEAVEYHIAKRVAPLGNPWFNGTSYIDLMNPDAVRKFIECTHERYKAQCGEDFGEKIPGIFTDEPNYLMKNDYEMPVMPWSEHLPGFFLERHGYSILEHLVELFFDVNDYHKIRYDFFDSASALLTQSFTKQYYDWCSENGLKMVGHFMAEDGLHYCTGWSGSVMPNYEYMHIPGIDKLGRRINQNATVIQVCSVMEQLDKKRAFSEVYGCIGQHCGFKERKWIADWQAVLGINFVAPHLSLYSMRGERKRDFPSNLFYQQPWWEEERQFADYITRLSEAASFGTRDVRILVVHPIGSAWATYSPRYGVNTPYDTPFEQLSNRFIEENLDFHFGDETLIQKYAKIEDGRFVVGRCAYDVVVVPPSFTLKSSTYALLKEFDAQSAGKLVCIHPAPTRIDASEAVVTFQNCVPAKNVEDAIVKLDGMFADRIVTRDTLTGKCAKRIFCSVRTDGAAKLVLLANTEPKREIKARIEICEDRVPYALHLTDGKIYEIPYTRCGSRVVLEPTMYACGSMVVLFADGDVPALPMVHRLDTGVLFGTPLTSAGVYRDLTAEVVDENALALNRATVYIDGKCTAVDAPMPCLWREQFYGLADGTPFEAHYTYHVQSVPEGQLYAVIECAQNLDKITNNGVEVTPMRQLGDCDVFDRAVNYIDVHFIRVPLENVREGENVLVISGKKRNNTNGLGGHVVIDDFNHYKCTELDSVYIIGDFCVENRNNDTFYITKKHGVDFIQNIAACGYPFYAGKVKYTTTITVAAKGKKFLRINDVHACDVQLRVNGKDMGMQYMRPYLYDVDGALEIGENKIEITASNTLYNLMGPNWIDNISETIYISPQVFENMERYTDQYDFRPFGIGSIEVFEEDL